MLNTALAVLPDTQQVDRETSSISGRAKALAIADRAQYESAAELLKAVKSISKQIDEMFDASIKAAHSTHKTLLAAKAAQQEPVNGAEREIKAKMAAWAEAERLRAEAEARRLAEEARKAEEARLLEEAAAAEMDGDDNAGAILEEAASVAAPVMAVADTTKVAGVSHRSIWQAEVVDLGALVKAAALRPDLVPLLLPDQTALNRMASALRGNLSIPGVRPVEKRVVSVRV